MSFGSLRWDRLPRTRCFVALAVALSCSVPASAQQASPAQPSPPAQQAPPAQPSPPAQQAQPESTVAPRDPTIPSERILEQLPTPELVPNELPPQRGQRRAPRASSPPSGLPQLPSIELRGIVMASNTRGRAMLTVAGRPVTITLLARDQQTRTPIPATQFAQFQPALAARAAATAASAPSASGSELQPQSTRDMNFEMSLQSSFFADGVLFNLEAFDGDSLVLQALPHRDLVLVRGN